MLFKTIFLQPPYDMIIPREVVFGSIPLQIAIVYL
jgi:hypothetical protein